ncbi:MAG: hypothetical protein FE78DRAFT_105694 [Acidomyces sp. 'richmondensis']|nr:MAG: hypothetical protein FE78DRAFT_105694 [Acidomyces sp. 'richmondensis']
MAMMDPLNITNYQPGAPLVPSPLPLSHAESDGNKIVELFQDLGRTTFWKSMVPLGSDRFVVSGGQYTEATVKYNKTINGTDHTAGAGFAHLIVFSANGSRIADATITPQDALEYHNDGIDYDGSHIWSTIAKYLPNSTAHVDKVDPHTMYPHTVLHIKDHEVGIVHDILTNDVWTLNWGGRNFLTRHSPLHPNAGPLVLCSGVATISTYNLGGIAIVDLDTMLPLMEIPIPMVSAKGVAMTENSCDASVTEDGRLRMYWLSDQHNSTLDMYEAQPNLRVDLV